MCSFFVCFCFFFAVLFFFFCFFFFSSRRRHTRLVSDWSSDVCSSDLMRGDDLTAGLGGLPADLLSQVRPQHVEEPEEERQLGDERQAGGERVDLVLLVELHDLLRSEERRVGKACRDELAPGNYK